MTASANSATLTINSRPVAHGGRKLRGEWGSAQGGITPFGSRLSLRGNAPVSAARRRDGVAEVRRLEIAR